MVNDTYPKQDLLRDALSLPKDDRNGATNMQADSYSEVLHCGNFTVNIAQENGQVRDFFFCRDGKKYSALPPPNDDEIDKYYRPSGDLTNATDEHNCFTLKQEYRKDPTNEPASNINQEETAASKSWKQLRSNHFSMRVLLEGEKMKCVLLSKGYWNRVIFPQNSDPSINMKESMIKSPVLRPSSKVERMEDSMNQSLASKPSSKPSSKVEVMEDSMNQRLVSKPSSKVDRVVALQDSNLSKNVNEVMKQSLSLKPSSKVGRVFFVQESYSTMLILKPSAKVENLLHHSGQWCPNSHKMRDHTQVSVHEDTVAGCRKHHSESTVDRKRKNPSAATAKQRKIVKVKNEEASNLLEPTRNASSNTSQRSSHASSKTFRFWTKEEEQTLMKKAKNVGKGFGTWQDVAEDVSKVGKGRTTASVRIVFGYEFSIFALLLSNLIDNLDSTF